MTSAGHLRRCLAALRTQQDAPPFDVTVVCDPAIAGAAACASEFPEFRILTNHKQRTALELVSRVLRECTGSLLLLTKDNCVPAADWVRTMVKAQAEDRAVVGGRVEPAEDASAVDWAFFFVDFSRYTAVPHAGWASSLTVCNVSYRRDRLQAVRDLWHSTFVETAVNTALASRFGGLWLDAASQVTMQRRVTLGEAMRERYVLGRLFAYSRLAGASGRRRLYYAAFAPALPVVLLARLTRDAWRSRRHRRTLLGAWLPLTLLVVGRAVGEWVGYVTARPPGQELH